MNKSIQDYTDKEIANIIANYKRSGKTEGGAFSLTELGLEKQRRLGKEYNGRDVVIKIVKLAQHSSDGLVTYKELWASFYPGQKWVGHKSVGEVVAILQAAIYYCASVTGGPLPLVTVAVVGATKRDNTKQAKERIFEEAQGCGLDTGTDIEKFYQQQMDETKQLVAAYGSRSLKHATWLKTLLG